MSIYPAPKIKYSVQHVLLCLNQVDTRHVLPQDLKKDPFIHNL